MEFKAVELLLELPNLLAVCHHAGAMAIQLPHDPVDDELRVFVDVVEPLDPELGGDAQAFDESLIFRHIVGCTEM
jgi:hypothetical protein